MTIPPAFLDELRARVSLGNVVGRRVKLTRAGRELKGCCPFHNEKSPSFFVNDDKAFYHCFGCGVHGDVIRFVVEQEGLSFRDAVASLAAEAGLQMPVESAASREREQAQAGLHDVTGAAANWFTERLEGSGGEAARAYLTKRGVDAKIIQAFGLGFAPDSRNRLRVALGSLGIDKLVETGLLIMPEAASEARKSASLGDGSGDEENFPPGHSSSTVTTISEPYDRFRGRLMFPIRDPRGRVIGFGGRILGDGQPKYLNSPDTPLFDKGRTLYNLDRAAPVARKSGRLLVVEGYMDVIGLAQAGIADAVAPLGTALTEMQLQLLWRVVPEPILCFDGDAAGQKASVRAAMRALPLLEPGQSLRFATLPRGKDPDDVIRDGGSAAFEELVRNVTPLHDVIWQANTDIGEAPTPEQKAAVQVTLRNLAKSIQNPDVRSQYDLIFRDRFWREFGRGVDSRVITIHFTSKRTAALTDVNLLEQQMLAVLVGMLNYPHIAGEMFEELGKIPHPTMKMKNLSEQIIEALIWAPDLDRAQLAYILKNIGFRPAELDIRKKNKLPFSFTASKFRSSNAEADLRTAIAAIVRYHELQDRFQRAAVRARASHQEGANEAVMEQFEATKTDLLRQKLALWDDLWTYVEDRPVGVIDLNEMDWTNDQMDDGEADSAEEVNMSRTADARARA